ncbi:MAG: MBL fold metallo-hydrolase [Bacteroides sp.]|jgi:L-ascorbate metabolism protein UlaG (beta-lactamase superfamily)|nr:MBL fold metallo-hydrolase [Bacteroides sp.]
MFRHSRGIKDYESLFTQDLDNPSNGSVKVTFLGATSLLLDDGETQILTDGFFSRHGLWKVVTSQIHTDRKKVDNAISKYEINRVKAIFVSHSHYDHAFDVAYVTQRTGAVLFGSPSTLNIARGGGLGEEQMAPLEPGREVHMGAFSITAISARHSPPSFFNNNIGHAIDRPLSQPAWVFKYVEGGSYDFLIKHAGKSIYIIPSANYVEGMRDKYKADVVFFSIGNIAHQSIEFKNTLWENSIEKLKPDLVIPIHWDNFFTPLSSNLELFSPIIDNTGKSFDFMIEKCQKQNIDLKILQGGKSIVLFKKKV